MAALHKDGGVASAAPLRRAQAGERGHQQLARENEQKGMRRGPEHLVATELQDAVQPGAWLRRGGAQRGTGSAA